MNDFDPVDAIITLTVGPAVICYLARYVWWPILDECSLRLYNIAIALNKISKGE